MSDLQSSPLLEIDDVSFAYLPGHLVLNHVSFSVAEGELISLLGPNGAGKSTLLNCIMHLLKPTAGTVSFQGDSVATLGAREIARNIAYVPQAINVSFAFSVRDFVAMGRTPHLRIYEQPHAEDMQVVDETIERLGIEKIADQAFNELSGGQQQLASVARAIAQKPRLILFDEPTSALDYGNQVKVLKMIHDLSVQGYSIIMTTHNPDHPILLDSSVCILDCDGHLRKGSSDEMMQEDILSGVYESPIVIRFVEEARRRVCITPSFNKMSFAEEKTQTSADGF